MTIVAFDTDETIYNLRRRPDGGDFVLFNWRVVNILIVLREIGCRIVLWSGGGKDHAERMAHRLCVHGLIDEFSMKSQEDADRLGVDICFDDQFVDFGPKVKAIKVGPRLLERSVS